MANDPHNRHREAHALALQVAGVKEGDQLAQIGCADGGLMAALAAAVGPSGRAVVIVPDQRSAARAKAAAAAAGVASEVEVARLTQLPGASATFDLVFVDDTDGLFASVIPERRRSFVGEIFRILRPGGRVVAIRAAARGGIIGAVLERMQSPGHTDFRHVLGFEGFRSIQQGPAPGGLVFVVALKPLQ
jgi:cyclopropane fatty-acyl-phospholipid synthase-like methyltransferase